MSATASSRLPVSFGASGSCTVSGDQVAGVTRALRRCGLGGIADAEDNCVDTPNPSQLDSNQDGYGEVCDPDYNDDGVVNVPDLLA